MYTYLQQALPRVVILKYISQVILTDHRFILAFFMMNSLIGFFEFNKAFIA